MSYDEETIVGLDIGTTKICAIVGEVNDSGGVDIIGIGTHPSKGLRKGVVVNIDATMASIQLAVRPAPVPLLVTIQLTVTCAGSSMVRLGATEARFFLWAR